MRISFIAFLAISIIFSLFKSSWMVFTYCLFLFFPFLGVALVSVSLITFKNAKLFFILIFFSCSSHLKNDINNFSSILVFEFTLSFTLISFILSNNFVSFSSLFDDTFDGFSFVLLSGFGLFLFFFLVSCRGLQVVILSYTSLLEDIIIFLVFVSVG